MAKGTLGVLAKSASKIYVSVYGAFWFELVNAIGLVLILQAYVIEDSFFENTVLAITTFGQVDAESVAALGVLISVVVTIAAFTVGALFFLIRSKPILIITGQYAPEKMLWTIMCFIFSLFLPGFIILWVVMVQYYHIKGLVVSHNHTLKAKSGHIETSRRN